MKCNTCGIERKDVKPEYCGYGMYSIPVTAWICSDCEAKARKRTEEIAKTSGWKGNANCPACKSPLRSEGDINISITDIGTIVQVISKAFDFHPVRMTTRFVTDIGKAIFLIAKDEKESKVRQCSKCEAYATKCPTCAKIFIVGKPKILDGVRAKCPKCGEKVVGHT